MRAEAWPAADKLFRSDPRWMGSDDAYSVPLGGDRTLWLFGDTFIADEPGQTRRECHFIRNSIAIQNGADPSSAEIAFHWGASDHRPLSFFEVENQEWLWPLDGMMIDSILLLFLMKVRSPSRRSRGPIDEWREEGPLGFFDVFDFQCIRVLNPQDPPGAWDAETVTQREDSGGIITGAALLRHGEHLLAYGWRNRKGYLCRWDASRAAAGDLRRWEWWTGDAWSLDLAGATVVLPRCTTEFTVHRHRDRMLQVQLTTVDGGAIQSRHSDQPHGPFSLLEDLYSPPEADRPGVFIYAAKAHPQLTGCDLVCTYASNGRDVDETLDDDSIYFPRFVRVWDEREKK